MSEWFSIGTLLAVLTPLAGVPLTAILFYLRGLREQYAGRAAQLVSRLDRLDGLADTLLQRIAEVERNSTTREEWVRESMLARRERRLLTKAVIRLQVQLQAVDGSGLAGRIDQSTRALAAAAERMDRVSEALADAAGGPPMVPKEQADA